MSGERQKQNAVYNQGLNHESASISTEGKGDQGDQNPSERFHGTNGTRADPAIGHSQSNKRKERHARKDKT